MNRFVRTAAGRNQGEGGERMPELDRGFLRKLASWSADGVPVASLYLDVDGRRYPRRHDYERRAEDLVSRLKGQAESRDRETRLSVCRDGARMMEFVHGLDRQWTRGIALFSASAAGLWEDVAVPRPLKDRATLATHPHVLPLEVLVEAHESFCTVIVDREKARIFLARMGRIREETGVFDDVPGQHDQGGWAQARYQRHIEEHMGQHLKHVSEVLLRYFKRRKFDHLVLAGPDEIVPEFERGLHDYLKRRIAARTTLAMTASADQVLERCLGVEEAVEARREKEVLERLAAAAGSGGHALTGLGPVLGALNDGRVDTLIVPFGLESGGFRCTRCERLAVSGGRCDTCGGPRERVPDVVESAVAAAIRQSSRVETLTFTPPQSRSEVEVGALLRY
jgi:peptide chain release factor subunit 1